MDGENKKYTAYIQLLNNINIFQLQNWLEEVGIQCGDENVRKRCERMRN
jgi:hypothetical protein